MLEYKGYIGKVEFDCDARIFHGEVGGIRDTVTFQGRSVAEAEKAFRGSVDDYLAYCKERGEAPDIA
jgi:predicted HicB family RNase H-like nuclease